MEQDARCLAFDAGPSRADGNSHDGRSGSHIEDLLPIAPPTRSDSALMGNLPLCAGRWERLNIYLPFACLTRIVRHPFPVRRELSGALAEADRQPRKRSSG